MMNFLKTIILIMCLSHNSYANQPPAGHFLCNGCAGTGIPANINTLLKENAYGYVQNFITLNNAQDGLPELAICLYSDSVPSLCDITIFQIGDSFAISTISTNHTLRHDPLLQNMYLTATVMSENVAQNAGVLCLTMSTPYGQAPLVCKNVALSAFQQSELSCVSASNACIGVNYSQSIFNFSGSSVACVTDVLNNIFFETTQCPSNENSYLSSLKAFASFQQVLQGTVGALLILYVMMFGFNVILNQDKFSLEMVFKFIIKFVLVAYFSVGIGSYFNTQGQNTLHNGMIDWGLPIFREVTNDFAQMVFEAAGTRSLCSFDISQYPDGEAGYALWDIVDCRIGAYLGIKSVYNLGKVLSDGNFFQISIPNYSNVTVLSSGPDSLDPEDGTFPECGFPVVLIYMLLGGNLLAFISIITFLLIFLSVIIGFVSVYVVCFITMHVLVYISPIFVPLALFERTAQYFQAWLKATVSCTLQPMIMGGFVALMITMYDDILFGPPVSKHNPTQGCEFVIHQYEYVGTTNGISYTQNYNTFEMVLPSADETGCTKTPGYQMIAYLLGEGYDSIDLFLFSLPYIRDTLDMTSSAMILMIFSVIFYYFSSTLYDFSSDITGGISVKDVALNAVEGTINGIKRTVDAIRTRGKSEADRAKKKAENAGNSEGEGGKGGEGGGKDAGSPKGGGGAESAGGASKGM